LAKPAARPKARNQINWHLRRGRKQEISLKQACGPAESMKLKKLGLAARPQRRNKFKASLRPGRKLEYVGQIGK